MRRAPRRSARGRRAPTVSRGRSVSPSVSDSSAFEHTTSEEQLTNSEESEIVIEDTGFPEDLSVLDHSESEVPIFEQLPEDQFVFSASTSGAAAAATVLQTYQRKANQPTQTSVPFAAQQVPPVHQMARNLPFVAFNAGSPLQIAVHHDIPPAALKSVPYFTGENQVSAVEHIKDIATLCGLHQVQHEDVALKLLAASFRGKALIWFRSLAVNSIATWDALGSLLISKFEDRSDNLSLVEQLTTIKRQSNEHISDFNFRFQRTWDRIPATVKPSNDYAFLFYLKAFNSDISVMIQSMGGRTLPDAFDIAVRAENSLIQAGKLPPRPPMPYSAEIQQIVPAVIPPLAVIPPMPALPACNMQVAAEEHAATAPIRQLQEQNQGLIDKNDSIMKTLQTYGNEITNLKRQQGQYNRPNQASYQENRQYNQASSSNQPRQPQGQQRNFGQRTNQSYNYATPSNSKELVVVPQNNYAHDGEWCNTCNAGHYWLDCAYALESRRRDLLKEQQITNQGDDRPEPVQQQVQQLGNPNATLMNFTEDEVVIAANFDQNQIWKPVSAGIRSKV